MEYQEVRRYISVASLKVNMGTLPLSNEQSARLQERFGDNLRTSGVKYGDDFIVIPIGVLRNWRYYAGFEYIDTGDFDRLANLSVYPDDEESGRVAEVLEIIKVEPSPPDPMTAES